MLHESGWDLGQPVHAQASWGESKGGSKATRSAGNGMSIVPRPGPCCGPFQTSRHSQYIIPKPVARCYCIHTALTRLRCDDMAAQKAVELPNELAELGIAWNEPLPEIAEVIAAKLICSPHALLHLAEVSRFWHDFLSQPQVWERLSAARFGEEAAPGEGDARTRDQTPKSTIPFSSLSHNHHRCKCSHPPTPLLLLPLPKSHHLLAAPLQPPVWLPEWSFIQGLDSGGNDVATPDDTCTDRSPAALARLADARGGVAFNTNGGANARFGTRNSVTECMTGAMMALEVARGEASAGIRCHGRIGWILFRTSSPRVLEREWMPSTYDNVTEPRSPLLPAQQLLTSRPNRSLSCALSHGCCTQAG